MTGGERVRDRIQAHGDGVALAGDERLRPLVAVAVGEVEQAAGDEQRGAVRGDVAQPYADESRRPVARERQHHLGEAEDLDALCERLGGVAERDAVLGSLVEGGIARARRSRTRRPRRLPPRRSR